MQSRVGRPNAPMSLAERSVLEALEQLPSVYEVTRNVPRIQLQDDWSGSLPSLYEPDFVVRNGVGQQVLIEVKSEAALSLANMVRLAAIDTAVRQSGNGFLLLVLDSGGIKSRATSMPEFKNLHIRFIRSPFEAVSAVEQEFSDLMNRA